MTTNKISDNAFATPASEATHAWQSHTADFTVHWGRTGAVLAANGEIDAANAGPFADYVKRCSDCCEWLILDLSALAFIGTVGFSALQAINARCAKGRIQLMVIPGLALTTVLRICDPDGRLPLVKSLEDALAAVQKSGRPLHAVH
ncbi:STAS domain-containing protein [Mycolicibacter sp. MYC123]|uniref:STAS domain-containing protein n=1 Tax=[Mycobacterium] zoologicum TaxID=2872311 RepID=A0ABU5YH55_9MYCO|nr:MULTISPECIES: STAS domain-containing protein [unclassified Mycolicibacter]MEB3048759.1 STAS domain-containing protein [Mycolicibacter sp. MYC123]MEB3064309.1 STAS domain-containing protein [Mycolicibacter sp. MYC101]